MEDYSNSINSYVQKILRGYSIGHQFRDRDIGKAKLMFSQEWLMPGVMCDYVVKEFLKPNYTPTYNELRSMYDGLYKASYRSVGGFIEYTIMPTELVFIGISKSYIKLVFEDLKNKLTPRVTSEDVKCFKEMSFNIVLNISTSGLDDESKLVVLRNLIHVVEPNLEELEYFDRSKDELEHQRLLNEIKVSCDEVLTKLERRI